MVEENELVNTSDITETELRIMQVKEFRVAFDNLLQDLKNNPTRSRERALAITKLQECIMWLGMELKALGTKNPYPNSYNPANTVVDPTADGLKL